MAKKSDNNCKDLVEEWQKGKTWVDGYTEDFPSLLNLADAVALSRSDKAPVVGITTLATAVRQIPRASIQQLPVFSTEVNGTKLSIPALVSSFIVRRIIFSEDTFGKGLLSTMQISAEAALSVGFQATTVNLNNGANGFGTMMKPVHYNDFTVERGVLDASDSYRDMVRTRVTRSKLKRIAQAAKQNPETTWNVAAINELLMLGPNSTNIDGKVSTVREHRGLRYDENTFDIITSYSNEPYGEITTFAENFDKPLRKMKSKSKFGYPRLQLLVIDPDMNGPFGVSRLRLGSPQANYANIFLQSTAKMQLLNADPPTLEKGTFMEPVQLKRGARWRTNDTNADVKLVELSNSTLSQYTNVLNYTDNQIWAVMGVTPGSTGTATAGSKYAETAAGVKMEQQSRDLANTQITHILENHLRQYALTALDLYVSEQVGKTPLIVDDECKDAINRLEEQKYNEKLMKGDQSLLDPMTGVPTPFVPPIGDDNVIMVNWEEFYDSIKTWTVTVDLSMAKDTLDDKKRADAQDMLTVMSQTGNPNDPVAQMKKSAVEDVLLEKTLPEVASSGASAQQAIQQNGPMPVQ